MRQVCETAAFRWWMLVPIMKSKTLAALILVLGNCVAMAQTNQSAENWKPSPSNMHGQDFPQVKVLFTSGVVKADEVERTGTPFVRKPYFLFEIERHIKTLLAAS